MKTLVVAATQQEVQPLNDFLEEGSHDATLLITGVGMLNTAYHLTKALLLNKYDLVINAGVAGTFNKFIAVGDVVQVVSERSGDLGAEDHDRFLDLYELGLSNKDDFPFKDGILINSVENTKPELFQKLRKVSAVSVNKVHGDTGSIERIKKKYSVDIESMEGAAVFFCCLMENVTFTEIRAISNYVEPRNRDNWNITLAVENLNKVLIDYFKS